MFIIMIAYKSGKIEIANIPTSEYTDALVRLTEEGMLEKMVILG